MSLQGYYDAFRTGYWANPNPKACACHGGGYALSEVDTWHQCPYHHVPGQPHPEEGYFPEGWDQAAELEKYRARQKEAPKGKEWAMAKVSPEESPLALSFSPEMEEGEPEPEPSNDLPFGDSIPF